jgi:hypothetical protein
LWWSTYRSEVVIFTHPVYELLNNCMNKTALQDIQKTLNIIRN